MNKIDEKTVIPLGFLFMVIGGVFWLSNLHSKVNAAEKQLDEINSTSPGSLRSDIKKQAESLARIEGALGLRSGHKDNDQ